MAFRYQLEALLRLRRSEERQVELRLRAAALTVVHIRSELQQLELARMDQLRDAQGRLERGGAASLLHYYVVCDAAHAERHAALRQKLEEAESLRVEQLKLYQVARRKSEILDALRQQKLEEYNLEFARSEQRRSDEAFLMLNFIRADE
jgi:flagellar export protein FliJ